tara:strand:+ start:4938 stop:5393 length:456 start_codon:yes stop_codon:yes gene_type:complete
MKPKIILGTDHAGFSLKEAIKDFLIKEGYEVEDVGTHKLDPKDDYPDFISKAAKKVSSDKNSLGIILGGSGQGEAITANKVKGIRAALYYGKNMDIVKLSRKHNDANILSLGARFLTKNEAITAVKTWLATGFSKEKRHVRRIKKISDLEK